MKEQRRSSVSNVLEFRQGDSDRRTVVDRPRLLTEVGVLLGEALAADYLQRARSCPMPQGVTVESAPGLDPSPRQTIDRRAPEPTPRAAEDDAAETGGGRSGVSGRSRRGRRAIA